MSKFDSKTWNPNVFEKYMSKVPNVKENSLIKNGLLNSKPNATARLRDEVGGNYFTEPMYGLLDGDVINYDGVSNITATNRKTFEQGKIIIGRAKAWAEKDFSRELTGIDWISNIAAEVKEYYDAVDQSDILSILKGIFNMTDTAGNDFVAKHSYDISEEATDNKLSATSMNTALQKACGDKKKAFKIAFMHSVPATNLENLQLLEYLKYTDAEGIQRDLTIAQYNGKLVVVDDEMPTTSDLATAGVYTLQVGTAAVATDKITIFGTEYTFVANDTAAPTAVQIKVGSTGTAAQQAANIKTMLESKTGIEAKYTYSVTTDTITMTMKKNLGEYAEPTAVVTEGDTMVVTLTETTAPVYATQYTTYVLGEKFFDYDNVGVKVPNEMDRDPYTNGGIETLITRQRKMYVPKYISFTKASMATSSPTNAELENGANWEVVNDGESSKTYVNHKMIPLARIISRG